jgi:hypothetical protein
MALDRASARTGIQEPGRKMKLGTGAQKSLSGVVRVDGEEREGRWWAVRGAGRG